MVHTWTNQDLTQTLDEEDKKKDQNSGNYLKPLAVYAQVTKGGLPVLGKQQPQKATNVSINFAQ